MGMAASQARFLQLSARKTNIEYVGQQINQQRLALANASAGLYEKMLTLETPTPPSSQDEKYNKQGYTFTDSEDDVQKKLSYMSTKDAKNLNGVTFSAISITPKGGGAATTIDSTKLDTGITANSITVQGVATALGVGITAAQRESGYVQTIQYVTLTHQNYNVDGELATVKESAPALLTFDANNRLLDVEFLDKTTINLSDDDTTNDPKKINNLTFSTIFDDKKYNDDMNEYEFKKASYDYQMEQINAETKVILQQDKSLELKMKQLDTEHTAIQTEMDAVQKVVQKNIESTFKTFSS